MKLEILHVPDCPNLPPLLKRLAEVTDLPVTTRVIDTDADAARFRMAGSPTLLQRWCSSALTPAAAHRPTAVATTSTSSPTAPRPRPGPADTPASPGRSSTRPKPNSSQPACSSHC